MLWNHFKNMIKYEFCGERMTQKASKNWLKSFESASKRLLKAAKGTNKLPKDYQKTKKGYKIRSKNIGI